MRRERAKELLPIIQAYAEGKTIQFKDLSKCWDDIGLDGTATFHDSLEYRIKPEPREFYVHPKCGKCHEFKVLPPHPDEGWIKVREVLE